MRLPPSCHRVEKNRNNVELTVRGAGTIFRAKESTSDMFASVDAAIGTIEGQIRKNKTRLEKRMKSSFAAAEAALMQGDIAVEEDHSRSSGKERKDCGDFQMPHSLEREKFMRHAPPRQYSYICQLS